MFEYGDAEQRTREPARLGGIAQRLHAVVEGHARIAAIPDESLEHCDAGKTPAVLHAVADRRLGDALLADSA